MSKILVIYYSFEGNTEIIAQSIAQFTHAELLSIKPVNEIKSTGFSKYFWGGSQVFMKKTPELITFDQDLSNFDIVFIGTPIWAGTYAPPIKTLFSNEKLKAKSIYFFYTHDGGPGKVEKFAKIAIEQNNKLIESKGFIHIKKETERNIKEVQDWITKLNLQT
ncbi:MAG: flavodoxin [Tenericutes bacterium HGW-Tenericutes-3]|nr:MAG: flavodoxin [Tenericutes bacterium HGW-Tenericutes-3]